MLNTDSVQHNYINWFVFHDDVLEVAEDICLSEKLPRTRAYPFTACVRVLELWKNARLKELDKQGIDETQLTEEMLWLDIEWPYISRFALRVFGPSSFQKIFPVVMKAGFARQRYIKRDAHTGALLCDASGTALIYATYEEARLDTEQHPGRIIHQALFESEALNAAIAGLDRPPAPGGAPTRPQPPTIPPGDNKNEGTQRGSQTGSLDTAEQPSLNNKEQNSDARGGNPVTTPISSSTGNVPYPSQKNQGATQMYQRGTGPSPQREGAAVAVAVLPRHSANAPAPQRTGASPQCADPSRQSEAPSPEREAPVGENANHKDITKKTKKRIGINERIGYF